MAVPHFCIIGYIRQLTVPPHPTVSPDFYHTFVTLCYEYINGDSSVAIDTSDTNSGIKKIRVHCRNEDEDKQFSCFVGQRINNLYDDLLSSAKVKFAMRTNRLNIFHQNSDGGHRSYLEGLGDLIDKLDDVDNEDNSGQYLNLYLEAPSSAPLSLSLSATNSMSPPFASVSDSPTLHIPTTSLYAEPSRSGHFRTISDSSISIQSESLSSQDAKTDNTWDSESDDDSILLQQYGYEVIQNIIKRTANGCVYEAQCIETSETTPLNKWSHLTSTKLEKHVAIKKVTKQCDEATLTKEAMIVHYLTVRNKAPRNNICNFVEFIETEKDYFLVEEYAGNMTLGMFTQQAHEYIKQKRLPKKEWRVFVKFVFWQLIVNMYWMHYDMNCCHLGLVMNNILLKNAHFVSKNGREGAVSIDIRGLMIKLCDFSAAEVFESDSFKCIKPATYTDECQHKSPEYLNGNTFMAMKADTWSLGVVLYTMLTGLKPYQRRDQYDEGYVALQNNKLGKYLAANGFSSYISKQAVKLIKCLLNVDEEKRLNTKEMLHWDWFKTYYKQCESIINKKSKTQRLKHMRQQEQTKEFPFYKYNKQCL
eukprot:27169_1